MTRCRRLSAFFRTAILLGCAALVLGPSGLPTTACAQDVLNGIAAKVNKDIITFSQVREIVGPAEQNARETLQGQALVEKVKEIRLNALNRLIDRQLILQEFAKMKEKGAQIPAHVLDEHVDTIIREQFGNDRAAFLRTLAAQGYTLDRFRQQQEEEIIVSAMRGQQVPKAAPIPEAAIVKKYHETIDQYTEEDQVKLRMLVIRKNSNEGESRKAMMNEIREKIAEGAAFADLARMYTNDPTTQDSGGDWGWINKKTLNPELSKIAFSLKPGQLSQIVELEGNYYLLYCEARKPAVVRPLSEVHDEIEKKLLQTQRQAQQQAWVDKLREKAFVKIY